VQRGHSVGALMAAMASRGTAARIGALPVDPLAIQSR
jgi:hypothetical protein